MTEKHHYEAMGTATAVRVEGKVLRLEVPVPVWLGGEPGTDGYGGTWRLDQRWAGQFLDKERLERAIQSAQDNVLVVNRVARYEVMEVVTVSRRPLLDTGGDQCLTW